MLLTAKRAVRLLFVLALYALPAILADPVKVQITPNGFEPDDDLNVKPEDEIEFDWKQKDFPDGGYLGILTSAMLACILRVFFLGY